MTCKSCKDSGWISVKVPTDLYSGESYQEDVPCEECEEGEKAMREVIG